MANAKISALPSATTPLGGSEVLPIVQSGVTDKVTVTNLLAPLGQRIGASEYNYRIGTAYGSIDSTVTGAVMFDGKSSYPNKLGVNNTAPVDGGRSNDAGYVAGAASVAGILAGYDNVCNALAGIIASQHGIIYSTADHATIIGGAQHAVLTGSDYGSIFGGDHHTIEADCDYAVMVGGQLNTAVTGGTIATRGHTAAFLGGESNSIGAKYGSIISGSANTISGAAQYGVILNGTANTVTGLHAVASGNAVTVSGSYSVGFGLTINVSGLRSTAFGQDLTCAYSYSSVRGKGAIAPFEHSHTTGGRQRGGTSGNNLAIDFTCSNETTDTTLTSLILVYGSTDYPKQPASSVVTGIALVTGVSDAGVCSSFQIVFTSERVGTGTPTIRANTTTTLYNGLAIVTVPTMNAVANDIYRVRVVGIAATNIRWEARIMASQIVYT